MTDRNRPKERRLHKRVSVDTPIELGSGREGTALLRDISRSGLACLSPVSFDEMAILEVTMTLPLPGGGKSFRAGGAVVRSEPSEDGRHLVAVFFTHMDEANRRCLDDFLAQQGG